MESIFKSSLLLDDKNLLKEDLNFIFKVLTACYNDEFNEYVAANIESYKCIKTLVDNLNYLGLTFWASDGRLMLTNIGHNMYMKIHSKLI